MSLDDLISTFCKATGVENEPEEHGQGIVEIGMRSILHKHIEPMIAEAFANGQSFERDQMQPNAYMPRITPEMYAARIIGDLTK